MSFASTEEHAGWRAPMIARPGDPFAMQFCRGLPVFAVAIPGTYKRKEGERENPVNVHANDPITSSLFI
ncbi:hypothetical protein FRC14_001106 [Serendipita sp. 396]|nr:hypothetical protein FRC14_001106 [Serendipita sp. 396]